MNIEGPLLGQGTVCEAILRASPEWFGIEAATAQYNPRCVCVADICGVRGWARSRLYDGEAALSTSS
jgi:hypothetical protein